MSSFYIDLNACYEDSRLLCAAAMKISGEAVKIREVKESLDLNYAEVITALECLEQKASEEAKFFMNAGTALYNITKEYERTESSIISNMGVLGPIDPSTNPYGEVELPGDPEFWEKLFKDFLWFSGSAIAKLLDETLGNIGVPVVGGLVEFVEMVNDGVSIEEALVKACAHTGIGFAAGAAAGAIVGSIFPGPGTVAGAVVGFIIGFALQEIGNAFFDYVYDNWDELVQFAIDNWDIHVDPSDLRVGGLGLSNNLSMAVGPRLGTAFG